MTSESTPFRKEALRVLEELNKLDPEEKEYQIVAGQLRVITEIAELDADIARKNAPEPPEPKKTVSPDTILLVAGNLLGILAVLNYERLHVVTSKALGFVMKPR